MRNVNIYTNKDGRMRAYDKDTKKVISYPRLILEEKLGRILEHNEQVHHIDENPLNNDPENLEVLLLGEHQKLHNPVKYYDMEVKCAWCGKTFIWTAIQQRSHYANRNRLTHNDTIADNPFCSKKCIGEYGAYVQNNHVGVAK